MSIPIFNASFRALVIPAAATDVFELRAPQAPHPPKIVRLLRWSVSGTATAIGAFSVSLVKRSTLNTGGTSTTASRVPLDSKYPNPTAFFFGYTVSPGNGTSVGTMRTGVLTVTPADTTTIPTGAGLLFDFSDNPVILRAPNESICLAFSGATITGGAINCWAEWTEEMP